MAFDLPPTKRQNLSARYHVTTTSTEKCMFKWKVRNTFCKCLWSHSRQRTQQIKHLAAWLFNINNNLISVSGWLHVHFISSMMESLIKIFSLLPNLHLAVLCITQHFENRVVKFYYFGDCGSRWRIIRRRATACRHVFRFTNYIDRPFNLFNTTGFFLKQTRAYVGSAQIDSQSRWLRISDWESGFSIRLKS